MNAVFGVILFVAYAGLSCYGLYLLKIADSLASPSFFIGGILYGLGAFIWLLILRAFPLSMAFPIASGVLMLGTSIIGVLVLKESFSFQSAVGIAFILSGIAFLSIKMDIK